MVVCDEGEAMRKVFHSVVTALMLMLAFVGSAGAAMVAQQNIPFGVAASVPVMETPISALVPAYAFAPKHMQQGGAGALGRGGGNLQANGRALLMILASGGAPAYDPNKPCVGSGVADTGAERPVFRCI
jgi:hypothetical protein